MDSKKNFGLPKGIIGELFIGWLILVASGIFTGRFICIPLGNVLLVSCAMYTLFFLLLLAFGWFVSFFSKIDDEMNGRPPRKEETELSAHGYIVFSTIAYILLWIVVFIIFPEDTSIGETIRQWKP